MNLAVFTPRPVDETRQFEEEIRAMHEAYVRASGLSVILNITRLRAWWELHGLGFRAAHVVIVAAWLKKEIQKAQNGQRGALRPPAAMNFSNFTRPDKFEEDHAQAVAAMKIRTPAAGMPQPALPGELATVEDIREAMAKMREKLSQ